MHVLWIEEPVVAGVVGVKPASFLRSRLKFDEAGLVRAARTPGPIPQPARAMRANRVPSAPETPSGGYADLVLPMLGVPDGIG